MKTISATLLLSAIFLSGCMSARVATTFDLESPLSVSVYENGTEITPTEENERILASTIKFWLPKMREAFTTYPTARYRLIVRGKDKNGKEFEDIVFVGSNWIGDGRGVVTLADTQVFKLHMTIKETIDQMTPFEHVGVGNAGRLAREFNPHSRRT